MTTQTRNEAAERLLRAGDELLAIAEAALLQDAVDRHETNEAMQEWVRAQAADPFAAERRATVDEIRQQWERAQNDTPPLGDADCMGKVFPLLDQLDAILDKVAAR